MYLKNNAKRKQGIDLYMFFINIFFGGYLRGACFKYRYCYFFKYVCFGIFKSGKIICAHDLWDCCNYIKMDIRGIKKT